jgi:hypothetical protein
MMVPARDHVSLGPDQTRPQPINGDRLLTDHSRGAFTFDPIRWPHQPYWIRGVHRRSSARILRKSL